MAEASQPDEKVEFTATDEFLRRVRLGSIHVKTDGTVSSAAFENDKGTNSLSVNWGALASIADTLRGHDNFGVVILIAENIWSADHQDIEHTPNPENQAHCGVIGRKNKRVRQLLARSASEIFTE